jgi:uncharacterized protein YoxC
MDTLNVIVTVFQLIFYVTAIILAIYLISSLKRITGSVEKIESEVTETSNTVSAFVTDANIVINDIKEMSGEIKSKIRKVEGLSDAVVEKGYEILDAINQVQLFGTDSVTKGLKIISGISSGVKEFFHRLKRPSLELKPSVEIKNLNELVYEKTN